jgi:GlcNAc-P-P-Und epimerase
MTPSNELFGNRGSHRQVLILGGSGFIGTRLGSLFSQKDIAFRIGDLRKSDTFPDRWNECDVRHRESMSELVKGAGAIINLAAVHRDDVRPLSLYQETNVGGAAEVCQAARAANVQTIIFTSSVAVYGFQPKPVDENGPFEPFNEYGRTKLGAESVYRAWAHEDPSRTLVIVRPTVVFGEGNRGNVYNLFHQIASGRFMMVGKGKNIKSMAYVGNIAAFLAHVLSLGPGTHIFNYVDGPDMETHALVEFIRSCLGQSGSPLKIPKPAAMAGGLIFDVVARLTGRTFPISAIRVRKFCESTQFLANRVNESGFIRPYSLREGLERTIRSEFLSKTSNPADALTMSSS